MITQLPVASLFNLIYVYLFLPISRKDVAVCIGMAISVITISATAISEVRLLVTVQSTLPLITTTSQLLFY